MALPTLKLREVLALDMASRDNYFEVYGRFIPGPPDDRCAIRVGSKTLYGNDTHDLKVKFTRYLGVKRRGVRL